MLCDLFLTKLNHQGLLGGHNGVVGEGDNLTCDDIATCGEAGSNLIVIAPRNIFRFARIVDIDEYDLIIIVAEVTIGVIARDEVRSLTTMDDLLALAPLEESARIVVQIGNKSILGTAIGSEVVGLVALPSTREIYAQPAMALAKVFRYKHHLVASKHLWYATQSGHHGNGELGLIGIAPNHIAEAVGVVVAGKDHHVGEVVVEEVV